MLKNILLILQIIVPLLLIACILLQQRGTALGRSFGGESGGFYFRRRGLEKKLFWATVALGALFLIISLVNLVV